LANNSGLQSGWGHGPPIRPFLLPSYNLPLLRLTAQPYQTNESNLEGTPTRASSALLRTHIWLTDGTSRIMRQKTALNPNAHEALFTQFLTDSGALIAQIAGSIPTYWNGQWTRGFCFRPLFLSSLTDASTWITSGRNLQRELHGNERDDDPGDRSAKPSSARHQFLRSSKPRPNTRCVARAGQAAE
jgi:hypothetical protein